MSSFDTLTKKLNLKPGINKNTTEFDAEGGYVSSDKVRFFYGEPEKIGGCQEENYVGEVKGVAREVHTWSDLDEELYLGIGAHKGLHLLNQGVVHDITPVATSASATDVINTSSGSNVITVSIVPTGAQAGDYFVFACVTASLETVSFTSTYQILSAETTYFTFQASTSAVNTCANAGGNVVVDFLLSNGLADNGALGGWGGSTWGDPGVSVCAGWSEPRTSDVETELRHWSIDNWGEDGMAVPQGGSLYYWEASAGTGQRATIVSAAPSVNNYMNIAQEGRHVIMYGTHTVSGIFDPMLIRWSDSENYLDWTPSATNQAGEFRLENGSKILGAVETKNEILVFTDESAYRMHRIGGALVYQFTDLGRHNGLMGPKAAVDVNGTVYWMGFDSFMLYNGTVQTLPCTVQKALFGTSPESVNPEQKQKVFGTTLREFNEIWWHYPSRDSTENDRYVVYNYLENIWYDGTFGRTAWHDVDIFDRPYALDENGQIWIHEQGTDIGTAGMKAVLKSSFFDIEDGDKMVFIDRIIPDVTLEKELNYSIKAKKYPQDPVLISKGPYKVGPNTRKISTRIRGRQMQMRYSTSVQADTFRIGSDRISLKPDGER